MKITEGIHLVGSGQMGFSAALDCHIYVIQDENEAVVIDSGAGKLDSDVNLILNNIENDGINPRSISKIFLTHAHADHAGGAKALKEQLKCTLLGNSVTKSLVERGLEHELGLDVAKRSGFYGDDYTFKTCEVDSVLNDGEEVKVGKSRLKAIHTPGHSTDSMCYVLERKNERLLFTGDVLNHGGKILLLNCYGFDLKDYRKNIRKLAGLGIDMLFPGHGVFTIQNGQDHIDLLLEAFDKLLINSQLVL
jgi:glyoxylase-like metal-dependent hydrolase (beta-lactamase superfamily II)